MKYKVGDKVRIKSKKWYRDSDKDRHGNVMFPDGMCFNKNMAKFCGKVGIINFVIGGSWYKINLDFDKWFWTEDCFEEAVE